MKETQEKQIYLMFKYSGGKIWNGLPNNIQNTPSVEAFKYAYSKHSNIH